MNTLKKLLLFLLFLIIFLIQTTLGEHIKIFDAVPNLLLVYVIIYSINSTVPASILVGSIAGLLIDVSMQGLIGLNALIMTYIAIMASFLSSKILYERKIITIITVFVLGFLYEFLNVAISSALITDLPVFYITLRYTLPSCVYNSVVSIGLVYVIDKLKFEYIRGI